MSTDTDLLEQAERANHSDDQQPADEPYGYQPVNWRTLTEAEQQVALEELTEWVTWLLDRYPVKRSTVPTCWQEHEWLIEELSALHVGWLVCFDEQDTGLGPLQWHERFHQFRERMHSWDGSCGTNGDNHRPDRGR